MSDRPETTDDIIREMRDLGALDEKSVDMIPRSLQALGLRTYADRFEAARKRETAGIVALCVDNRALAHPQGSAAAMRAALEAFQRWYDEVRSYVYHSVKLATAVDKMRAALAAPARNCDRMPDIDKLTMCDLAKSPCKSTLECASREELLALVRWLLVPATEQAGERR